MLCRAAANDSSMPPPAARVKADDDDIFGDAGTDYVCELPKVGIIVLPCSMLCQLSSTYACCACHMNEFRPV